MKPISPHSSASGLERWSKSPNRNKLSTPVLLALVQVARPLIHRTYKYYKLRLPPLADPAWLIVQMMPLSVMIGSSQIMPCCLLLRMACLPLQQRALDPLSSRCDTTYARPYLKPKTTGRTHLAILSSVPDKGLPSLQVCALSLSPMPWMFTRPFPMVRNTSVHLTLFVLPLTTLVMLTTQTPPPMIFCHHCPLRLYNPDYITPSNNGITCSLSLVAQLNSPRLNCSFSLGRSIAMATQFQSTTHLAVSPSKSHQRRQQPFSSLLSQMLTKHLDSISA